MNLLSSDYLLSIHAGVANVTGEETKGGFFNYTLIPQHYYKYNFLST